MSSVQYRSIRYCQALGISNTKFGAIFPPRLHGECGYKILEWWQWYVYCTLLNGQLPARLFIHSIRQTYPPFCGSHPQHFLITWHSIVRFAGTAYFGCSAFQDHPLCQLLWWYFSSVFLILNSQWVKSESRSPVWGMTCDSSPDVSPYMLPVAVVLSWVRVRWFIRGVHCIVRNNLWYSPHPYFGMCGWYAGRYSLLW